MSKSSLPTAVIELQGLHKAFGAQKVLNGLSLQIPKGEITVIIGRSGEGKSVLLKTLIGLVVPDDGKVWVEGKDLFALSEHDQLRLRKKFGMLFQNAALFDSMNVYDNLAFPLREHTDWNEDEVRVRVFEKLEKVGLPKAAAKMPSELSGGMRKRVGLARALMLEPEIILYDEPTTGLDPMLTDSIDNLIMETQKVFGLSSVVVSHDIVSTMKMADKIAMLHEGKILEEGSPEKFRKTSNPLIRNFLEGKAEKDFIG